MNEDKLANHKPDAQWSKWPKFVSLYYPGVPGGSKNPDDQTEVHSGELEAHTLPRNELFLGGLGKDF